GGGAAAAPARRAEGRGRPPLPKGFGWLHDRITSPEVRAALGGAVAIASARPAEIAVPKGCRQVADGIALFVAPDDDTALAAAATLRTGAVVASSGLLVLPGLARLVEPRARAERDALAQLRAMTTRLSEELVTSERAHREVGGESVRADGRPAET